MIDQNQFAETLERIARGLREGTLEVCNVQQEAFYHPLCDPLDGCVNGHKPMGEFSLTLKYLRREATKP